MSETEGASSPIDNEDLDEIPGYKPPEKKTLEEMKNLDKDDEALERYKVCNLGIGCLHPFLMILVLS